jgi:hypothetical protein
MLRTGSLKGRETCERLWTVVGTCAMQGRSAFEFILAAVRAYFRGERAPPCYPPWADSPGVPAAGTPG